MSSNTNDWLPFLEKQAAAQAAPRAIRPMYAAYGKHETETCGKCAHLIANQYHDKIYYKCELLKMTRGAGTDFRRKWQACGKFEKGD